jgi:multidrug efflux pump subunit AcrA (membrane-fusion protein)
MTPPDERAYMQALLRRFEDTEHHPVGRSLSPRRRTRRRLAGVTGVTLIVATVMTVVVGRLGSPAATADTRGIDVAGHIEAAHQTTLDFGGSGQVVAVNVKPGQAVEPGMLLASLDTAALEAVRAQAGSALGAAQAKLSGDQAANPGAQAEAAALGVEDAAQSQVGAASSGLLDIQRLNESTVVGVQLGLVATRDIVAAAQAQVDAAKRNLDDTRAVDTAAVNGARQALDAVTTGAQAAADTAQAQRDAASRAAQDATRVNQANVKAAQALVDADAIKLAADQAIQTTDCATTNATLCAADRQIVSTDQQTLSKDQSALGQATALAKQSNDQAQSAVTAADVLLGNARSALSAARAIAQSAVDQQATRGVQSDHLAQSVLDLAGVALQAARDSTGPVSQNTLELARLRARQGIDQAQAQLLASQASLHSAQRAHAALHAPAAVQLILTDQSQVETAQAQAVLAQHSLDSARLVAPVHGIVEQINVVSGQQVGAVTLTGQVAGTGQTAGAAIATGQQAAAAATHAVVLQTPDTFQLSGAVRESDIVRVHVGDRVTVVATASPLTLTGKVTDIAPTGTVRGNAVTFGVTAAFEAPGTGLRSGMSARMRILVQGAGQPPGPDSTPAGRPSTPMSSAAPTATPAPSVAATSPPTGG